MKASSRLWGVPVFLLLLLLLSQNLLFSQEGDVRVRVLVLPFESRTGRAQDETIARTITDTVTLTLQLLGRYELSDPGNLTSADAVDLTETDLDELAGEQRVDTLIYGTVLLDEAGALLFSLTVYDRAEERITVRAQSRAPSIFDVFDAADDLVRDAVSGFSGVRIAFGSLRVTTTDEGEYLLYLDNSLAGENVSTLDRVLAGERLIEIRQRRGDLELLIHRESVLVEEGTTRTVTFSFPVVTEEERRREEELRDLLRRELAHAADPEPLEAVIAELEELYLRLESAYPEGPEQISFYRDRLWLAREMQELVKADLRSLAAVRSMENLRAFDDLREPWLELVARYREAEREAAEAADAEALPHIIPPARRWELVRDDTRRNLTVLAALVTLERAAVVDEGEAAYVDGHNQQILSIQSLLASSTRPYTLWTDERVRAQAEMRRYARADRRRRPAWHWIAGGIGAGALGYAGYVQFSGILDDLDDDITTLIDRYEASTDFDEILDTREDLDDKTDERAWYQRTRTIAAGAGLALVGTAVVARMVSRSRPARIWSQYRDHPFPERWTAAGLSYRGRALDGSDPPSLLVIGEDETFRLNGRTLTTPQMIPADVAANGESPAWQIEHITAPAGVQREYRLTPGETGIRVLYLGAAR